jgi:hypothetical protein
MTLTVQWRSVDSRSENMISPEQDARLTLGVRLTIIDVLVQGDLKNGGG